MDWRKNRLWLALGGMALALVAGLGVAVYIAATSGPSDEPPPASQGGLVVQTGRDDDTKLDPKRPLRCFVKGQFIGELPLSDCAQKNGVAAGALDVGLDPSGALAGANAGGTHLTPLTAGAGAPAGNVAAADDLGFPAVAEDVKPEPIGKMTSVCWRQTGDQWTQLPGEMDLASCVRAVFAGHCPPPGAVKSARWGDRGLRLSGRQIELTSEEGDYRPLTTQTADCGIAPFGRPSP